MYIPKNRIITNLQTNQNEFVYKGTNTFYNGYYWKSYDGKYFTGKNPNDNPIREIELSSTINKNTIILSSQTPILFVDYIETPLEDVNVVVNYSIIKNIDLNKPDIKLLPSQYYPTPTQDDYNFRSIF
jgi:hypothetical protein